MYVCVCVTHNTAGSCATSLVPAPWCLYGAEGIFPPPRRLSSPALAALPVAASRRPHRALTWESSVVEQGVERGEVQVVPGEVVDFLGSL